MLKRLVLSDSLWLRFFKLLFFGRGDKAGMGTSIFPFPLISTGIGLGEGVRGAHGKACMAGGGGEGENTGLG